MWLVCRLQCQEVQQTRWIVARDGRVDERVVGRRPSGEALGVVLIPVGIVVDGEHGQVFRHDALSLVHHLFPGGGIGCPGKINQQFRKIRIEPALRGEPRLSLVGLIECALIGIIGRSCRGEAVDGHVERAVDQVARPDGFFRCGDLGVEAALLHALDGDLHGVDPVRPCIGHDDGERYLLPSGLSRKPSPSLST